VIARKRCCPAVSQTCICENESNTLILLEYSGFKTKLQPHLDQCIVDCDSMNCKVDSDCCHVCFAELIRNQSAQQRCFANTLLANKNHLDQVICIPAMLIKPSIEPSTLALHSTACMSYRSLPVWWPCVEKTHDSPKHTNMAVACSSPHLHPSLLWSYRSLSPHALILTAQPACMGHGLRDSDCLDFFELLWLEELIQPNNTNDDTTEPLTAQSIQPQRQCRRQSSASIYHGRS
jgi:hypothetical protein